MFRNSYSRRLIRRYISIDNVGRFILPPVLGHGADPSAARQRGTAGSYWNTRIRLDPAKDSIRTTLILDHSTVVPKLSSQSSVGFGGKKEKKKIENK